jgi:hypothetical protein
MKRSRLHWYAIFVALCTLLVVISGAAVTSSRDRFQNAHMAVAGVDILLIVGLCVWRRAGWSLLAVLAADAALARFQGPVWGTLHAVLAALLFASVAAMVLATSRSWQCEPELVQDYGWPSLRSLSAAAAFLVAVQVGFGAGFRHSALGVMPHLLGALVVTLFMVIVGAFVTHQFPKHAVLRPMAVWFMTITGIQAFLGMTAFLVRMMGTPGSPVYLIASVAHVTTGSLTLAVSVMLAMEIRRSVLRKVVEGG